MSIETMTGDEFVELTVEEHEEALGLYADAAQAESAKLPKYEAGTTAHEECLDRMARLLTLRRVHQVRLDEIKEEMTLTPDQA
jgi:hypothetical protein